MSSDGRVCILSEQAVGALLNSASSLPAVRQLHATILRAHLQTPFLTNHLINLYSKLGRLRSAHLLLLHTPSASRSVVTWTSFISAAVTHAHFLPALTHFSHMRRLDNILPNDFTFPCLFKAAASLNAPSLGRQLHALSLKLRWDHRHHVACGALDMYLKTGLRRDASKLFAEMPHRSTNIAAWNALICNAPNQEEAAASFRQLPTAPDSITFCAMLTVCASNLSLGQQLHAFVIRCGYGDDVKVSNALIHMYGESKQVMLSEMVFEEIEEPLRNNVSWCSMACAYHHNHMEEKALSLFLESRRRGIRATPFMVSALLSASAALTVIHLGMLLHGLAVKTICVQGNAFVGSALVHMYASCASIDDCERAFYEMPDSQRNLFTYNALIGGYAQLGRADMALRLFEQIPAPNHVTLVCVLTACSRGGMVKAGMDIFESMPHKYGIQPEAEHYACVVDMLGRSGMIERAYDLIQSMPIPPTISVWGALLGACKVYKQAQIGRICAEKLFELDPTDSGNHVLLSNIYAADGRWEDATLARKDLGKHRKGTGYSWMYVKNSVHAFRAKDMSQERYSDLEDEKKVSEVER